MVWLFGNRGAEESAPEPTPNTTAPLVSDGVGASDGGGVSDGGGAADQPETEGTDPGAGPATDEDRTASSARADAAARVWVDHSLSATEWQDRLRPQVTDQAWPSLALPDPQRVGPTEVTGDPEPVSVDHGSAVYNVPTDAGMLQVVAVSGGDGTWLVSDISKDA